ncbi:E3 ubiquitin-protein ligase Hakai-like [Penaeus chinensis]|uniref:E3 ubiquitin-protein ligase Hakai-like n=1 Tax=Penaeus chinensis TaxID=139456 RepID=UPI001FB80204|nr:E3 ubiquitin-protein ligase Hakai-like [Penaeus chinensis]
MNYLALTRTRDGRPNVRQQRILRYDDSEPQKHSDVKARIQLLAAAETSPSAGAWLTCRRSTARWWASRAARLRASLTPTRTPTLSATPPPPPAHANAYTEPNPLAAHGTHATHAHVEPVHAHAESQQHTHHAQYIQQEYTPPAPPPALVEMHHSASYHHMPPSATTAAPTYTHAHAVPVSHTQTLPHPRSGHARAQHAHAATLQRRSSLYMDPMITPLAPPPAYGSPTTTLAPDMMVVVPMVAETVCITPNAPLHAHSHARANPPDQYPAQPFPTSFSSDRMESAV